MVIKTLGAALALALFLLPAVAQQFPDVASDNAFHNLPRGRVVIRHPSNVPQCDQGPLIIPPCGNNKVLVIFDQPVYDDDGIFVVCYKKVPFCVPAGLQPEG